MESYERNELRKHELEMHGVGREAWKPGEVSVERGRENSGQIPKITDSKDDMDS